MASDVNQVYLVRRNGQARDAWSGRKGILSKNRAKQLVLLLGAAPIDYSGKLPNKGPRLGADQTVCQVLSCLSVLPSATQVVMNS